MLEGGLQGLQVAVKLNPRLSCTIDPRPSKAIHCPQALRGCRPSSSSSSLSSRNSSCCQPVHFGYAIPVRIHTCSSSSIFLREGFVQLVLEVPPEMATTATTSSATKPTVRCDPDEDIAAIAKQISDHAEAIYQTWKSRGLAPADILTCHNNDTAADKFGSALTPPVTPNSLPPPQRSPSIELLAQAPTMDNNRLERLVNNFVSEDKARLAAAKTYGPQVGGGGGATLNTKPMPSSIQYALQKFEKNPPPQPVLQQPQQKVITQPKVIIGPKPQISPKPRFPLAETIEYTLPPEITPLQQPQPQSTPSLQTWPLKNRVLGTDTVKQRTNTGGPTIPSLTVTNNATKTNAIVDQVALEEKRLINALKNGVILSDTNSKVVVNNTTSKPEVVTRWGPRTSTTTAVGRRPTGSEHQPAPHPELTNTQRQHLRHVQQAAAAASPNNPVRPFLTRGSVAERVLIFERCPSDLLLDKRPRAQAAAPKCQPPVKHQLPAHTTLQRHVKANRNVLIPRFYYPLGKPISLGHLDGIKVKVQQTFSQHADRITREQFLLIVQACELPMYWKIPLYLACGGDTGFVTKDKFFTFWNQMVNECHDASARFTYILTRGKRNWLIPEDFIPLVQDVVETHPGLTFLKEAAEFHSRYVHTVIARIFYCVNRSWSGRITLSELRRSNLLATLQLLEEEEDINQITAYFSYEHFYVIYCKFWELDRDHDLFIDKMDLTRHNDHALSTKIIDRIFSGAVTRGGQHHKLQHQQQQQQQHDEKMSYTEFVWFLLSEEDKTYPTAVEYWFRCMDLDGDGYLSMYELEYFYDEQMHRMEAIGIETLPFQDCLCQMLDMVKPRVTGRISLSDLKRCKMTPIFFDTFFNLEKYLDHEQRDPFASQRDHDGDGQEMSDWDRYAAEEYELLVAEEGNGDNQDSISLDEKLREDEDDLLSPNLDIVLNEITDGDCGDIIDDGHYSKHNHHNVINVDSLSDDDDDDDGDDCDQVLLNHNNDIVVDGDGDDDDDDEGDYAPDSDDCSI